MKFDKIVSGIRSLKIQSAISVAKNSIVALQDYTNHIDVLTKTTFIEELIKAKHILFKTRPTELQ